VAAPIDVVAKSMKAHGGNTCPPCIEEAIEFAEEDAPAVVEVGSDLISEVTTASERLFEYYQSVGAQARAIGAQAEQAVGRLLGLTKNTQMVNGRIPDFIRGVDFVEVKNVSYQAFTSQLRDYLTALEQSGGDLWLYTRPGTRLSAPLQYQVDIGRILHGEIPDFFGH
jgi:hypothetical protein